MNGLGGSKENPRARVDKVSTKEIVVVCCESSYCMELVVSAMSKRLG